MRYSLSAQIKMLEEAFNDTAAVYEDLDPLAHTCPECRLQRFERFPHHIAKKQLYRALRSIEAVLDMMWAGDFNRDDGRPQDPAGLSKARKMTTKSVVEVPNADGTWTRIEPGQ